MQPCRRARAWIQEASWSYLLGLAFFLLASAIILAAGAAQGSPRGAIKTLAKIAVGTLFISKILSGGYAGLDRWHAATGWPARIAALLPSVLTAWLRMDRANLRACLAALARRPQPERPPGQQFGLLQKSAYSTFVLIGLVSTFVDLPLNGFIASVMVHNPVLQTRIHVVCLLLAAYTLMWIIGDRRQMQGSSYVVGATVLDLKVGARLNARIALDAVSACEVIDGGAAAWRQRRGVPRSAAVTSTPADAANIVLSIDPGAGATITHWQLERPAPRYLFLFVDEPSQFAAALGRHAAPTPLDLQ